jgi:hypothetical protein
MHCASELSRSGQREFEQAERQGTPLRTILVMLLSDFTRNNLIFPPERSVRPSTRHGRQFSELWTTSGFVSSPRIGNAIACLISRRQIESSFLNIRWI